MVDLDETDVVGTGVQAQLSQLGVVEPGCGRHDRLGLACPAHRLDRWIAPELTTRSFAP